MSFSRVSSDTLAFTAIPLLVLVFAVLLLRRWALPKFLPGIPHHPDASRRILGDLPRLISHTKNSGGQVMDWMSLQCIELDSCLVQLALKPLGRPIVVLSDHATIEDILIRRTREFDRAQDSINFFNLLIPNSTAAMRTNERFRNQRHIWSGTMSSAFLNNVAAPRLHRSFTKLIQLWECKAKLATGRPFEASNDIKSAALDGIWAITHGTELGAVQSQIDFLASQNSVPSDGISEVASFSQAHLPPLAKAVQDLIDTNEPHTLFPVLRKYVVWCLPSFRRAWNIKERAVEQMLQSARDKFLRAATNVDDSITCAMDYVIGKEIAVQAKAGKSVINEREMKDETFLFLIAVSSTLSKGCLICVDFSNQGHETASTTLQWTLKTLAENPEIQTKLHESVKIAFSHSAETRFSTAAEIAEANIPYLDAVVHEVLRFSRTTPGAAREALVDTRILGYHIPKGTNVMVSLQADSFQFDDSVKQPEKPTNGEIRAPKKLWPAKDKRKFDPSRWLSKGEDGKVVFDLNAGPSLPFSAGPRGCFGMFPYFGDEHSLLSAH